MKKGRGKIEKRRNQEAEKKRNQAFAKPPRKIKKQIGDEHRRHVQDSFSRDFWSKKLVNDEKGSVFC